MEPWRESTVRVRVEKSIAAIVKMKVNLSYKLSFFSVSKIG